MGLNQASDRLAVSSPCFMVPASHDAGHALWHGWDFRTCFPDSERVECWETVWTSWCYRG